jgi:WhiB family redox-sensing transcriptional regulator
MNPTALFAALAGIPRLPGAACRGHHELFDPHHGDAPERPGAEAKALALCHRCPALAGCSAWFDGLPPKQRPHGVIAGRVNRLPTPGRPRKDVS